MAILAGTASPIDVLALQKTAIPDLADTNNSNSNVNMVNSLNLVDNSVVNNIAKSSLNNNKS